jgi:hypothetical protein
MEMVRLAPGPASESRQRTNPREVGHPAGQRALCGFNAGAALDYGQDASTTPICMRRSGAMKRLNVLLSVSPAGC